MAKYRKKPVVIEAVQFLGKENKEQWNKVLRFFEESQTANRTTFWYNPNDNEYYIKTLEGDMKVSKGDYIIKGINGELYPCKPDIFEKTYERVAE